MTNGDCLVLSEERNALDYLTQALVFLAQAEQNPFNLKWFVISFHGALYSFMLLALQSVDQKQIYKELPAHLRDDYKQHEDLVMELNLFEGKLHDFGVTYKFLKNPGKTSNRPYVSVGDQDTHIEELNKIRNQLIHFKPMMFGSQSWYFAEVCSPLLEVLRFCVNFEKINLDGEEKQTAVEYLNSIERLLIMHKQVNNNLWKKYYILPSGLSLARLPLRR